MRNGPPAASLVQASGLATYFPVRQGLLRRVREHVRAVDGVDLAIERGQTLGLVGETGCGKSTLGRTLVRLVGPTAGTIWFDGTDITGLDGPGLKRLRREMQVVFQDPAGALNPHMKVRAIVREPLDIHRIGGDRERNAAVAEALERVGLASQIAERLPRELSGGQQQRVGIARALVLRPRFVFLDEPVSSLDVSTQSQVLNLLLDLREQLGLTYLFISHDLAVVGYASDRIAVMYLGEIVEIGSPSEIYEQPFHPYTAALRSAVLSPRSASASTRRRIVLEGDIPSPIRPPSGCRFHTRCPLAQPVCTETRPSLEEKKEGRLVACHFAGSPIPLKASEEAA